MRRVLDFLGITRAKESPRPKMLSAVIGGVGLFFVLTGGSVIAGNVEAGSPAAICIGGALIVVGVACWVVEGVLSSRTTGGGPSR
jgi:drug/metabolite transporter (DMT)-like permease